MSTTTETEFLGEDVPQGVTTLTDVPEQHGEQQEQQSGTEQSEEGASTAECIGGGCVEKVPATQP
ncbi:hypothetical protein [Saccharothrix sp. Mg75]|uniref:hypothetical protein n=1 Tax=Saccharothrix sp. Mg75 TaxID=3445357 RepID=UPI003EEF59B7